MLNTLRNILNRDTKALKKSELLDMILEARIALAAINVQQEADKVVDRTAREHEYASFDEAKKRCIEVAKWNRDNGNRYVVTQSGNKVVCRLRSSREWKLTPRATK